MIFLHITGERDWERKEGEKRDRDIDRYEEGEGGKEWGEGGEKNGREGVRGGECPCFFMQVNLMLAV